MVAACWLEVTVDPAGNAEPSTILLTKFVPLSHGAVIVNDMPEVFAVGTLRVATPLLTLTEVPSQNVGLAGVILLGLPPVMGLFALKRGVRMLAVHAALRVALWSIMRRS